MTYRIVILPVAQKQLEKLENSVQERMMNSLERIRTRPYDFVKKLAGSPLYRLRVGDYRIILQIKDDVLIIYALDFGHRKNIYK